MSGLFTGALVRLTVSQPEHDAPLWAKWDTDSQYRRLFDSDPPRLHTAAHWRHELESEGLPDNKGFGFSVRTLDGDKLIGVAHVGILSWVHRDAFAAIGFGDRNYWGRGYGTDAMGALLRFAFTELALHRVTLNVFAANERAIRSYEKAGFRHEGRLRQALLRAGQRTDIVYMGILREEWCGRI